MVVSAGGAVVISTGVVVVRHWARDTALQHNLDRNFPFLPVSICTTFGNSSFTECRNESKNVSTRAS